MNGCPKFRLLNYKASKGGKKKGWEFNLARKRDRGNYTSHDPSTAHAWRGLAERASGRRNSKRRGQQRVAPDRGSLCIGRGGGWRRSLLFFSLLETSAAAEDGRAGKRRRKARQPEQRGPQSRFEVSLRRGRAGAGGGSVLRRRPPGKRQRSSPSPSERLGEKRLWRSAGAQGGSSDGGGSRGAAPQLRSPPGWKCTRTRRESAREKPRRDDPFLGWRVWKGSGAGRVEGIGCLVGGSGGGGDDDRRAGWLL